MMNCEEFARHVSEYLDDRVPYGKRIGIWFHAALCEPCRTYLDQIRRVVELASEVGERQCDKEPPDEMCDELIEEFRSKHG